MIALCVCALPAALPAQSALRTFTSPDGAFRFNYSAVLVRCVAERTSAGSSTSWAPVDSCLSQGGLCDDDASSATTIVCFAYPKDHFKGKPAFSGAAFFVAQVAAATEEACLAGSQDWLVRSTRSLTVGATNAKLFRISDAWAGGSQTGEIDRIFHRRQCYELGIQQAETNPAGYDPGTIREFTKQDSEEVHARLKQALDSFVFLK